MKITGHAGDFDHILALLKEHPKGLCIKKISSTLGLNRNSAAKFLDILHHRGQVDITYFGKAKVFTVSNRVPFSASLAHHWDYLTAVSRDGKVLYASDSFAKLLDCPCTCLKDRNLQALVFPPFRQPAVEAAIRDALRGEESTNETGFRYRNREFFVSITCIPTVFDDGKTGVSIGITDNTKVRDLEKTVDTWESQYRSEGEYQSELVIRFGRDRVISFVNSALCRAHRVGRQDLVGRHYTCLVPPDTRSAIEEKISAITLENPDVMVDQEVVLPGGKRSWERWRYRAVCQDGMIMEYRGVGFDISEIRARELNLRRLHEGLNRVIEDKSKKLSSTHELLQKELSEKERLLCNDQLSGFLLDNTSDMIAWFGPSGHLVSANRNMAAFLGDRGPGAGQVTFSGIFLEHGPADWHGLWERLKEESRISFHATFESSGPVPPAGAAVVLFMVEYPGHPLACAIIREVPGRKPGETGSDGDAGIIRSMMDGTPSCQFFVGRDHLVRFWNRALEDLTGIRAPEIVGTGDHWKAFYPAERPCLCDLLLEGPPIDFGPWYEGSCRESRHIPDAYEGEIFLPGMAPGGRWLTITASLVKDAEGRVAGALETLADVTEYRKAREALGAVESDYRSLLDRSPEMTVLLDSEGRILYENRAILRFSGVRLEDVCGTQFLRYIHPDEREYMWQFFSRILEHPGSTRRITVRTLCCRDIFIRMEWTGENLFHVRGIRGILVSGRKVTGRKQGMGVPSPDVVSPGPGEEGAGDLFISWRPDYTVTGVNDALCRLVGKRRDEVVGRKCTDLVPPECVGSLASRIRTITPSVPVQLHFNALVSGERRKAWCYWMNRGVFDSQGRVVEIQSSGHVIDLPTNQLHMLIPFRPLDSRQALS